MDLSYKDRVLLYWIFEVLKKLAPDADEDRTFYAESQEIVAKGFTASYGDIADIFVVREQMPLRHGQECYAILHMLDMLLECAKPSALEGLERAELLQFRGFYEDDDVEFQYLDYAEYLLTQHDSWNRLLRGEGDTALRSPTRVLPSYRAMLQYWESLTVDERNACDRRTLQELIVRAMDAEDS